MLLVDEFIKKYEEKGSPMNPLGEFVYTRTYSQWKEDKGRRETFIETIRRAVEYNCSLAPTTKEEAEDLFDNLYNLRQFLSGRTLWIGGTDASKLYPIANYNCAGIVIDSFEAYKDMFYVLMVGTGVGFRILKSDVEKLPNVRTDIKLINRKYEPVHPILRKEFSEITFNDNVCYITIGDSKEGWVQSMEYYFNVLTKKEYRVIDTIQIDYSNIRQKGERLKKFGGTASGHESMKNMFTKIHDITQGSNGKLEPIECMDISNIIGENVVVGGVRRTAQITLFDSDDEAVLNAKNNMYQNINGQWVPNEKILHRRMSNNSIMYYEKPNREQLHWHVEQMRFSGEPGFYLAENALKRRKDFAIPNPCGEILLQSRGLCNLTTVNAMSFVDNGILDKDGLVRAQRLSARAGYRMTNVELELHQWDLNQKQDRLLGCSLTGWQDMLNATGISLEEEIELLKSLRAAAHEEGENMAKLVGGNKPLLTTTVKPEGTLSLLPTVSSGLHFSHSPFYIRRIRINAEDPLVKVCKELGYSMHPEVGQTIENCNTMVIEFPVKAPAGKTKYDVSAIEQLEIYKKFMIHYVDHNASITVTVRDSEWEAVEEWIWENWEYVIGISFLSLDDSYYPLLPYEDCTEEEYNRRVSEMKAFDASLLSKYEVKLSDDVLLDSDCASGVCPIR